VGLASVGRSEGAFDLAACVWVAIDEDVDRARALLAEKIAYYGPSFAPYLLERAGLSVADFDGVTAELRAAGLAAAARLVTPAMLQLGIAGGPAEVIARCTWLIDHGARHVSFGPPLGADPAAAVELLGDEVLPALRRHAEGMTDDRT
jgi:5,10-methylenetetrahydromethanopterin reductase